VGKFQPPLVRNPGGSLISMVNATLRYCGNEQEAQVLCRGNVLGEVESLAAKSCKGDTGMIGPFTLQGQIEPRTSIFRRSMTRGMV
jgi:hypothetical protein